MTTLRDRYKTFNVDQELSGPEEVLPPQGPSGPGEPVEYMTRDPYKEIIPPQPPPGFSSMDEMGRHNKAGLALQDFQRENPQSSRGKASFVQGDPDKGQGIEITPEFSTEERDYSDKQGFIDHYIEQQYRDRGDPVLWKPAEIAETEGIAFDEAVKQQKYAIRELERIEQRFDQDKAAKDKIEAKKLAEENRTATKRKEAEDDYYKYGKDKLELEAERQKIEEEVSLGDTENKGKLEGIEGRIGQINHMMKQIETKHKDIKPTEEPGLGGTQKPKTLDEVKNLFKAGKIDRETAKRLMTQQLAASQPLVAAKVEPEKKIITPEPIKPIADLKPGKSGKVEKEVTKPKFPPKPDFVKSKIIGGSITKEQKAEAWNEMNTFLGKFGIGIENWKAAADLPFKLGKAGFRTYMRLAKIIDAGFAKAVESQKESIKTLGR